MTRSAVAMLSVIAMTMALSEQFCHAQQSDEQPHITEIVEGDDWSLPPDTQLTPRTGFGWIQPEWIRRWTDLYPVQETDELQFCEYVYFNWADVNPKPGIFHWSVVDKQVARIARTRHLGFALWPRIYARSNLNGRKGHGTGQYDGEPMLPRWLEQQGKVHFMPDGTVMSWLFAIAAQPVIREFEFRNLD